MAQQKKPGLLDLVARLPASDLARMARNLGLDPESVLKRLQALESTRLGGVLVDTATRAFKPGEAAGRIVIDHATRILSKARDLTRDLEELAGLQAPELHFGADGYAAELSVGLALAHMVGANSRLRAHVEAGDFAQLAQQVASGALEFAVAETTGADRLHARLHVQPMGEHTLFFYVRKGHPLAGRDTLTLPTILVFPLVAPRVPKRIAAELTLMLSSVRIDRDTEDGLAGLDIEPFPIARNVVLASDAVGLAPLLALETDLRAQRIALLPFTSRWLRLRNGVFYARKRQPSRVAQLFVTQLRQVEATLQVREQRALARLEDTKRRTPRRKPRTPATRNNTTKSPARPRRAPSPRKSQS
jgi:DNA-binding transcriptional LysR family regulator